MEHICDIDPNIVFFTETWLQSQKSVITSQMKEYGYIFYHRIRTDMHKSRGGGVGILVKEDISAKILPVSTHISLEYVCVKLFCSASVMGASFII